MLRKNLPAGIFFSHVKLLQINECTFQGQPIYKIYVLEVISISCVGLWIVLSVNVDS